MSDANHEPPKAFIVYTHEILPRVEPTGEVLQDRRPDGKLRPWKEYKSWSMHIAEAFELLDQAKRAGRMQECGSYLIFAECPTDNRHRKKLVTAKFCRERLCSMCASRRALMIASQVCQVAHTALERRKGLRFIFLTLTVPNVPAEELREAITGLYGSFKKMIRVQEVSRILEGYFRALEVTYNRERDDYHPHLHNLVAVPASYFSGPHYIKRDRWLELWQRATGMPEICEVDVRAVKPKRVGDSPLASAAAEVGKYAVTGANIVQDSTEATVEVVHVLHHALKGRRLIQFGGLLGKIHKELQLTDVEEATSDELVEVGEDPSCLCPICQSELVEHVYFWLGGKRGQYVG